MVKKKGKFTLVQALWICTGLTAHRGSRGIVLLIHDYDTRRGWGVSVTTRPLFTPGKGLVPIVQETGWARGSIWTGAKNLAPTGIQTPDRPARSQSLYRLRYPTHLTTYDIQFRNIGLITDMVTWWLSPKIWRNGNELTSLSIPHPIFHAGHLGSSLSSTTKFQRKRESY